MESWASRTRRRCRGRDGSLRSLNELFELFLREDGYTEFACLVELAARLFTGDNVRGFFGNAAGRLTPEAFDQALDLLARVASQRAAHDKRLAAQVRGARLAAPSRLLGPLQTKFFQFRN